MNQTHLHLLITHLPIYGSILGATVLAYGLLAKSSHTKIAAYCLFILSAIGAGIAYLSGEGAEETVENIQGVTKNMIEEHEDSALFTLVTFIISGIVSIVALFLTFKKSGLAATAGVVVLFISLISFGLAARTGYLGGQIRHTEISAPPVPMQGQHGENEEDD